MDDDPLADLDAADEDLLRLRAMANQIALHIVFDGKTIMVRCQNGSDVEWLCRRVLEQYAAPAGRTVN
ncbi:hypothetical protein LF41_2414 [Lysobacter dokdonensis DS-58]|uniref:Uncharacterized protein n=1 Tax=Lysobacter dokdonensis DS-58 TaxID=1300345 RepID=A0A0A2WME3_9GAMM|nr:hypothetical protein [Lysobacter dokdonensis]KGQ19907.1 hypothetical protein LF41_2414 [Lysobacter dokdonensis DS-58]